MIIQDIEVFDLYQDGTLVLKTNAVDVSDKCQYAWYVKWKGKTVFKSKYVDVPFIACQIKAWGEYSITGYVLDTKTKEKVQREVSFTADIKTSPGLQPGYQEIRDLQPVVQHISGPFWKFSVSKEPEGQVEYAWFIYKRGQSAPWFKQMYSSRPHFEYQFKEPGDYRVKLFALAGEAKNSVFSEWFTVND